MRRYFFDVETATSIVLDDTGEEVANEQAARDEAVNVLAVLAKDYLPTAKTQDNMIVRVRDEKGEPLLQLTLSSTLQRFK